MGCTAYAAHEYDSYLPLVTIALRSFPVTRLSSRVTSSYVYRKPIVSFYLRSSFEIPTPGCCGGYDMALVASVAELALVAAMAS